MLVPLHLSLVEIIILFLLFWKHHGLLVEVACLVEADKEIFVQVRKYLHERPNLEVGELDLVLAAQSCHDLITNRSEILHLLLDQIARGRRIDKCFVEELGNLLLGLVFHCWLSLNNLK